MVTALDPTTALVLIDLEKGIASMPVAHPAAEVIAHAAQLLHAFRAAGQPVVLVTVNPTDGPFTRLRTQVPALPPGGIPVGFDELVPEIEEHPGDLRIHKKSWNAFAGTSLHAELQARQVTGIVLAGISTSVGVEGTARNAAELGYHVAFATDAMTDRQLAAHEHSLHNIFPRLGELGTTQEVLALLAGAQ